MNRFYNSNDVNEDAATCSFPLAPTIIEDYPNLIEKTVRMFNGFNNQIFVEYQKNEKEIVKFNEEKMFLVDSTMFDIFTFTFIKGDPETALDRPNTMVITKSIATKYFGNEDPMGKLLRLEEQDNLIFEVTGVIEDIPSQSHFDIDMFGSLSSMRQLLNGSLPETWAWNPCWTYLLLKEGVTQQMVEDQLPQFYLSHYPDLSDQDVTLYLQALTDIHLRSHHDYEMHPNSNIQYVYILSTIAFIVLILACINFMNLATANSAKRSKEIGIKKVFGSGRVGLFSQFIGETVILSFISTVLAIVLVEFFLNDFNAFTSKNITREFIFEGRSILFLFLTSLTVGVIAGSYPAVFLSSFKPISVLSGKLKTGAKGGWPRKLLVVFQFSISISLIIGTLVVFSQLQFIRKADLGFKKDQIIILPTNPQISQNYLTFKNELLENSEIAFVTGMEDILGSSHNTRQVVIEGLNPDQNYWFPMYMVRHDFLETFDIEVVEGRGFSKEISSDTANAIMINEAMVKNMGWTNEEAIGKVIRSDGNERVIGVFKDFHILSLHKPINNFILDMIRNPNGAAGLTRYIAIRVSTDNYQNILDFMEQKWADISPSRPFEFFFLDDELNGLYKDEARFGKFSVILAILAIFIASLGLVGLTAYMAEQRTKEIGIRRVLGASIFSTVSLLSGEFIKLILIANLIAWPVTYFISDNWLQNFHQRIPTNWLLFFIAGVVTLLVALLITSFSALKASIKNPTETLRYE
jgi:putative ABC transport system permease protein